MTTRPPLGAIAMCVAGFLLLLGAVTATGGTDTVDLAVTRALTSVRSPALTSVALAVTAFGSFSAVVAVTLLASALLGYRTRRLQSPLVLLISVALSAATVYLVKVAVGRARPPVDALLSGPSLDGSFPSGHTTNGTVVYVLSAALLARTLCPRRTRQLLVAGAVLLAFALGVTRVYLGLHWPTDVLAGWLLAAAVVLGGTAVSPVVALVNGPPVLAQRRSQP